MADNVELNAGTGGATLATDDVGGIQYQITKLAFGALDAAVLAIAGAGSVTTGTQRVTLADNDPAVALLGTINTAAQLIDDTVYVDDADWTDNTSKHLLVGGLFQSTPQAITDGDVGPFQVSTEGYLITALSPTDNAVLDAIDTDLTTIIGHVDGQEALLTTIAGDTSALEAFMASGQLLGWKAEDVAHQSGDVGMAVWAIRDDTLNIRSATEGDYEPFHTNANGALWTLDVNSIAALAHLATLAGGVSGTEYQVDVATIAAGNNNIGDVDVASIATGTNTIGNVGLVPLTAGGLSMFKSIDLDESEEEVKDTAGQIYAIYAWNETAAPLFLKLYDADADDVTVGTTVPNLTLPIPANADSDGAGFVLSTPIGIAFGTAITAACTTLVADNDATAPGANDCVVAILFK